ncbi:hypothetical protein [Amycolatopsis sp. NPDC051071]|uniref:hypothetical protein n=1 Tax=Amycolatopsis sp. NPDC051071 TaxID=3154637 RepID=UPI0034374F57
MSSGDTANEIEQVRLKITEVIQNALQHVESKWAEAALDFEAAVAGYQNLSSADAVKLGFMEGNYILTDFIAKQVFISAMLSTMRHSL